MTKASRMWSPSRHDGLQRLTEFIPFAGRAYAQNRNFDYGVDGCASVSKLSPYIRHRMITEREVVEAVLRAHSFTAAEKFIQEVCWRTYWKGWLEQRPQVWENYLDEVAAQRAILGPDTNAARRIAAAERGETGIECFDAWMRELIETGYLHNHARMWCASIWIFTLKLPWALGADFFLRHLLDGDPASNTLSWRWVAGLHTRGKTYLARPDNIAEYTDGRFRPGKHELAAVAVPLMDDVQHKRAPLPLGAAVPAGQRAVLLVTEEDMSPQTWPLAGVDVCGVAMLAPRLIAPYWAPAVLAFKTGTMSDARERAASQWAKPVITVTSADELIGFAAQQGATAIITALVPVGLVRPQIDGWSRACGAAGIPLTQIARPWDSRFWPHASAGFFKLKEQIPRTLELLKLTSLESSS